MVSSSNYLADNPRETSVKSKTASLPSPMASISLNSCGWHCASRAWRTTSAAGHESSQRASESKTAIIRISFDILDRHGIKHPPLPEEMATVTH
jgi:hypothetical protein